MTVAITNLHIGVGIHIRHTAVPNFQIGPIKKFKNDLPMFVFVFGLSGGLKHIICCFLSRFILIMLALLIPLLGYLEVSLFTSIVLKCFLVRGQCFLKYFLL